MTKKRVVVTDHNFGDLEIETAIIADSGCELLPYQCVSEADVVKALDNTDVALVQMAQVTGTAIKGMNPNATLVRYGAGYDNVDIKACKQHGVSLANVPDYGTEEVAVHAMALLLNLLRRIGELDDSVRKGKWESALIMGDVQAADEVTLGLFGVGRIGLEMAARARGFGMRVIGHDPYANEGLCKEHGVEIVSAGKLWEISDAISLHAPLAKDTRHVINKVSIGKMKDGVLLVNCARGELIDSLALADALSDGKVAGAGLDVFDMEPLPADHPLCLAPNLILTPHAAWCSSRSMRRLRELAAQEVVRAVNGQSLRCPVDLESTA